MGIYLTLLWTNNKPSKSYLAGNAVSQNNLSKYHFGNRKEYALKHNSEFIKLDSRFTPNKTKYKKNI